MSEAKFTPGPWGIEKRGPRTVILKRMHWAVGGGPGNKGVGFAFGDTDANANLIAAAPDLLAALKRLASEITLCHSNKCADEGHLKCRYRQAADAIAKAEGR